ncbi:RHS repeat-associated core domain-containing protein [Bacteroides thetaiotaomicron]|uniref:DUF6443 domain-containing protein n=1 Tax=Bacteroides thetaiotaomicron TaxID=818 RepID=UPI0034A17C1F
MKQIIILIITAILLLGSLEVAEAQSVVFDTSKNYVLTRTPLIAVSDVNGLSSLDCLQKVEYMDEWGRSLQKIQINITPSLKSLATYQEYDAMGNPTKTWLPVKIASNSGKFVLLDTLRQKGFSFYNDERYIYYLNQYEVSPLKRIEKQCAPGLQWVGDDYVHRFSYEVLSSKDIRHYTISSSSNDTIVNVTLSGMYSIGDLLVENEKDEDDKLTRVYKDKQGKVVLEEKSGHYTYYVYDDRSRLCAVLPPQLSDFLTTIGGTWSNNSSNLIRQYAYLYAYDGYGRCSHKRLPGVSWIYYYYDMTGQLILTQDGNQRNKGECTFTIPDVNQRMVLSGICRNVCPFSSNPLQDKIVRATRNKQTDLYKGYSISGIELSNPSLQIVDYYDNYTFMENNGISEGTRSLLNYENISGYGTRYNDGYGGLHTGRMVGLTDGIFLYTVMYYDERGRMIQTHSTNHMGKGDRTFYAYNFAGEVIKKRHVHAAVNKDTWTEVYNYTYDHGGRLMEVSHTLDNNETVRLLSYTYDELGRIQSKKVHGLLNSTSSYTYNIRNWLKSINGSLFNENLYYTDDELSPFETYAYNGNIGGISWKCGNENISRAYAFRYDELDRLVEAKYMEEENSRLNADRFTERVTEYDKNGNILRLKRNGRTGIDTYGLIDDLIFALNGNQLKSVDDSVSASVYNNGFEFKDGAELENEYSYDFNGNLTKDLNKNIDMIQYNYLNLPNKVSFLDGSTISYVYGADGTKIRTIHKINDITTTTDYCGNVIYENGIAKCLLTEAGYISLSDNKYHYYLQDHQGNNRVVINQTGEIEETNHYYPFGGIFAGTNSIQPYKYNGKELDTKKDLNWYDYGARMYDVTLGKFMNVDPLAENYYWISPYVYCENNPINLIDPTGMASQYPPGGRGGFWDWSDYKFKKVSSSAQATDAAANRVFEGTGIGISYSVGSVKGKLGIGSVEGKFDVGFGNLSLKTKGTETSAAGSLVEAQAKVSVNSVSGNAGVTMGKGKIAIDANGVNTDFDMFSANAKVQVGNNSNTKLDSSGTVSVGAKAGPVDANVSINFKAAGEWIVGLIETVAKILSPEIILDPHKKE